MDKAINIEGWREELTKFNQSSKENYLAFYGKFTTMRGWPKVPISNIILYLHTVFAHDELLDALKRLNEWNKVLTKMGGYCSPYDPEFENCPEDANETLEEFTHWFCLHNEFEPVFEAYTSYANFLGYDLLNGILPSIDSPELISRAKEKYPVYIEFSALEGEG